MSEWRLLSLGATDPYVSQSLKEMFLQAFKRELIPNTLCFYVPKRHVWVGRRASVEKQVDLEYCRKEKIPIVRGLLGGTGAVIFDEDILDWTTLVLKEQPSIQDLRHCVAEGLRFMGLEAELKPRSNDVLVGDKKISGTAIGVFHGGFFIFGGDVIVDFNYDLCENALLSTKNHREWVTTLKAQLGREVSFSEVISALTQGFETTLNIKFDEESTSLTEAEKQILESLQEKYRSEEWTKRGRWSPVKDYWRPL